MTEQNFNPEIFTRYEKARILGARALQIAMNAPLLIKMTQEDLELIKYDALKIAEVELNSGVLPISVNRPVPQKKEGALKKEVDKKESDEDLEAKEAAEEEEIAKEGEIMALANPEDEQEDGDSDSSDEE